MTMHPVYKQLKIGCGITIPTQATPVICGDHDLCNKCMKKLLQLQDMNNDMAEALLTDPSVQGYAIYRRTLDLTRLRDE
jgi:hypothetical protein